MSALDATLSSLLVVVTAVYVALTYSIQRATQSSAKAAGDAARIARDTLEELRRQRLLTVQPRLVVTTTRLAWYGDGLTSLDVSLENLGHGSAFGVGARVALGEEASPLVTKRAARPVPSGSSVTLELASAALANIGDELAISVECFDIYGTKLEWTSRLAIQSGQTSGTLLEEAAAVHA